MSKLSPILEPLAPSEEESQLARDSSRRLAELMALEAPAGLEAPADPEALVALEAPAGLTLEVGAGDAGARATITLPSSALPLITRLLAELGQGHAVALLPVETELSTQQAADLLNVSRPFLVGLLEQRQIPYRKVGRHRRILLRDALAFKRRNEADRLAALAALQAQAQELDMGY